jgi:hypothetical protein
MSTGTFLLTRNSFVLPLVLALAASPVSCSSGSSDGDDTAAGEVDSGFTWADLQGQDAQLPELPRVQDIKDKDGPGQDLDDEGPGPDVGLVPDADAATLPPDVGVDAGADAHEPEIATGCAAVTCPQAAECREDPSGKAECYMPGTVVEEFDDQAFMDAPTTAEWGGGVLTTSTAAFSGDGSDGDFHAVADTLVDTTQNGGLFQYTSFVVDPGVTVTVTGPNAYVVKVTGNVDIGGWLRADGAPGLNACQVKVGAPVPPGGVALAGGAGGPGGGKGGDGGAGFGQAGVSGEGAGGGAGSSAGTSIFAAGAGGGSLASAGLPGTTFGGPAVPGQAGATYGAAELDPLVGGSGGGGGGGNDSNTNGALDGNDRPGGSGGGGGGAVAFDCGGSFTITGRISADGGQGGFGDFSGGGGGGSGGAIRIRALGNVVMDAGVLSVRGRKGGKVTNSNQLAGVEGGRGGDGIVRIESQSGVNNFVLNPDPAPSFGILDLEPDGGNGADGAFEPLEDIVLDTAHGPYNFTTFVVPADVTVTAVGDLPLILRSQFGMTIEGTIDVSGANGGNGYSACCGNPYPNASGGVGGAPGPGGFAGGHGGEAGQGLAGEGPGGAPGGPTGTFSSAGGAGYAQTGQAGGTNQCNESSGPAGGAPYGDPQLTVLQGGSGGGGAGDASAAACIWCQAHVCIVANDISMLQCPANPAPCDYCVNVPSACVSVAACTATEKWNPGSGGGGGGGALQLETPGQFLASGALLLNGGDGGDNWGAGTYNDGTCGAGCTEGCFEGQCNPTNGGSFGGSGGGGSGGALLVRAHSVRTLGWISAVGGATGTLSQGGGCPEDPNAELPIPGQGRGGRGSPGRIRIETDAKMGSILAGEGFFSTDKVASSSGAVGMSTWYTLPATNARIVATDVPGLGPLDLFEYQVAPQTGGLPDEAQASTWQLGPAVSQLAAYARFRITFNVPVPPEESGVVESVTFVTEHEVEPLPPAP